MISSSTSPRLEIAWRVTTPDGAELGTIDRIATHRRPKNAYYQPRRCDGKQIPSRGSMPGWPTRTSAAVALANTYDGPDHVVSTIWHVWGFHGERLGEIRQHRTGNADWYQPWTVTGPVTNPACNAGWQTKEDAAEALTRHIGPSALAA